MKTYCTIFTLLLIMPGIISAMEDIRHEEVPEARMSNELTEKILRHIQSSYELPKDKTNTALITAVSYSPNGQLIAAGSKDGTVHIWNAFTKELLHTFSHKARINDMSWNSKSSRLVIATNNGLCAYNTVTGEISSSTTYNCQSVCYSPNDLMLAVGIKQYDSNETKHLAIMQFDSVTLTSTAKYVADFTHLLPTTNILEQIEKNLKKLYLHWTPVNELTNLQLDRNSIMGKGFRVTCSSRPLVAHYSPNNNRVAVGTQNGTISIIDLKTETVHHVKKDNQISPTKALCWNSNSNRIATVTNGGIDVWDTENLAYLYTLKECNNASCVCWHAENFIVAGVGNTVQVWHIIDRQLAECNLRNPTNEQKQLLNTLNQLMLQKAPDKQYYATLKEFDATFASLNPVVRMTLKKLLPPVKYYYRNSLTTPAKAALGFAVFIGGYIIWHGSISAVEKLLGY